MRVKKSKGKTCGHPMGNRACNLMERESTLSCSIFRNRTRPARQPVSKEEKNLQFVVRTSTIEIKVSFDPQKMVDGQGIDL